MYNIRPTTKFQKDLKRVKKRGFDIPVDHIAGGLQAAAGAQDGSGKRFIGQLLQRDHRAVDGGQNGHLLAGKFGGGSLAAKDLVKKAHGYLTFLSKFKISYQGGKCKQQPVQRQAAVFGSYSRASSCRTSSIRVAQLVAEYNIPF